MSARRGRKPFTLTRVVTLPSGETLLLDEKHAQAISVQRHNESYSSAQWWTLLRAEQQIEADGKSGKVHFVDWQDVPLPDRTGVLVGGIAF